MESTAGQILQLSDLVSTRKCALRIVPEDASLPLGALLENDSVKIHASLSEAYQARADKILKAEANAANAAVAQEKQAA